MTALRTDREPGLKKRERAVPPCRSAPSMLDIVTRGRQTVNEDVKVVPIPSGQAFDCIAVYSRTGRSSLRRMPRRCHSMAPWHRSNIRATREQASEPAPAPSRHENGRGSSFGRADDAPATTPSTTPKPSREDIELRNTKNMTQAPHTARRTRLSARSESMRSMRRRIQRLSELTLFVAVSQVRLACVARCKTFSLRRA